VARDVFISYSQHDKAVADAVHAILDSADIHCRMAKSRAPGSESETALSPGVDTSGEA
jgi:hypothetical protein